MARLGPWELVYRDERIGQRYVSHERCSRPRRLANNSLSNACEASSGQYDGS